MAAEKNKRIAVIRIRGEVGLKKPVKETLELLRLSHKNNCSVLTNTPSNQGMVRKVKDYVTWGEIDEATFKELVEKRGEEYLGPDQDSRGKIDYGRRFIIINNKRYKKYFRLNPPRKGFGLKGIKMPFKVGGALGYRGEKINELIKRMI